MFAVQKTTRASIFRTFRAYKGSLASCLTDELNGNTRTQGFREAVKNGPQLQDFVSRAEPLTLDPADSLEQMKLIVERLKEVNRTDMLVDTYGRKHTYLRISLTERCNLRCTYCMPEEGVELQQSGQLLTSDEILHLVKLFASAGVNKIRLTGGEPLIRKDLVALTVGLNAIDGIEQLGITTNGLALKKKAQPLLDAGMTHFNISLDTLVPSKFEKMTRRRGFDRVMSSIHQIIEAGIRPKINCVVMRGQNEQEIVDFVQLSRDLPIDVRFIEWMPFDQNSWNDKVFVPYSEMLEMITAKWSQVDRLADEVNDTSKAYQIPGSKGQFGFITSMSEHFCGTCNRLRLTADGNLKVCLFGNTEVSLRDALRAGFSDDDLAILIQAAVGRKKYALGGHQNMYGIAKSKNRPMILIGG